MNRLNSVGWFWLLAGAVMMDIAAGLIIWGEGPNWPDGLFALASAVCTLVIYKYYKEESK